MEQCAAEWREIEGPVHLQMAKHRCVLNQTVLQEVTSSYFKHIDKPVHRHIPFHGAVCSRVEGDRGTGASTDGSKT